MDDSREKMALRTNSIQWRVILPSAILSWNTISNELHQKKFQKDIINKKAAISGGFFFPIFLGSLRYDDLNHRVSDLSEISWWVCSRIPLIIINNFTYYPRK